MEYNAQGYVSGPGYSGEVEMISLSPLGHLMIRVFDSTKNEFINLNAGLFSKLIKKTPLKKEIDTFKITSGEKIKKHTWEG